MLELLFRGMSGSRVGKCGDGYPKPSLSKLFAKLPKTYNGELDGELFKHQLMCMYIYISMFIV